MILRWKHVETSYLKELEDDDYLPVPRDPSLRAQSPMGRGNNINARAGQAPSGSDDSESDFVSFHQLLCNPNFAYKQLIGILV